MTAAPGPPGQAGATHPPGPTAAGRPPGRPGAGEALVLARAKLTLTLRVLGSRPDGYHRLDAEMVSLDLADHLYFSAGDGIEVVDGGAGPGGFGLAGVPVGPANLVAQALAAVGRSAHVRLVKRIPPGAGLGGGSADAAAVLRWAGLQGEAGVEASAGLGSDVAFCFTGFARARVTGVGDELEPLDPTGVEAEVFTLLVPPFGVPTGAVYQAWDELGGPSGNGPNDLEPAALLVEPRLATWRERLAEATGQVPVLAGSGSTWYVRGAYPGPNLVVAHVQGGQPVT